MATGWGLKSLTSVQGPGIYGQPREPPSRPSGDPFPLRLSPGFLQEPACRSLVRGPCSKAGPSPNIRSQSRQRHATGTNQPHRLVHHWHCFDLKASGSNAHVLSPRAKPPRRQGGSRYPMAPPFPRPDSLGSTNAREQARGGCWQRLLHAPLPSPQPPIGQPQQGHSRFSGWFLCSSPSQAAPERGRRPQAARRPRVPIPRSPFTSRCRGGRQSCAWQEH